METASRPLATGVPPTSYGRACANCARAKSKCISRGEGSSCERCHRLKKDCVPSVSARKRGRKAASSTAQLQEKLDNLVSLLQNQTTGNGQATITTPPSSGVNQAIPTASSSEKSGCLGGSFDGMPSVVNPALPAPPPGHESSMPFFDILPTEPEAEESLAMFREEMLASFPFVYIPASTSAAQLRSSNPRLWFCIMALTCANANRQLDMTDAIPPFLAQKIIVENERSIDLIQMIIIFIAWSQYQKMKRPYIVVMLGLAQSLIADMSLNQSAELDPLHLACWKKTYSPLTPHVPPKISKLPHELTSEDRRTLLAFFYMSTLLSITLKKSEPMSWTSQTEKSLQTLSDEPQCQGDEVLTSMVKLQLIAYQVHRSSCRESGTEAASFFLSTLQSKLLGVKNQLSLELQRHGNIIREFHFVSLFIHEAALARSSHIATSQDCFRIDTLNAGIESAKNWFGSYFTIPKSNYAGLTFGTWCHIAHCLVFVFRQMMLPEWDREAIRRQIDIFGVVDKMLSKFGEAAELYKLRGRWLGLAGGEDVFSRGTRIMAAMRQGWEMELASVERKQAQGTVGGQGAAGSGPPLAPRGFGDAIQPGPFPMPMYYQPEEAWLTDLFTMSL